MTLDFRETSAHLVSSHAKALDSDFKRVGTSRNGHVVLFLTDKEAHGIQSKLKFRRCANKAGSNRLFDSFPGKLDREELVIVIGRGFVAPARFNIPTIVQVAGFFFLVELNPVVESRNLTVLQIKTK